MVINHSKNKIDVSVLDAIRNSSKPVTAAEICKIVELKPSMVGQYLKRIRQHVDDQRSYAKGYGYGKKYNKLNHQENFIYWYDH